MDKGELKTILEALLFAAPEPLGVSELRDLIQLGRKGKGAEGGGEAAENPAEAAEPEADPLDQLKRAQEELEGDISRSEIEVALAELSAEYQNRGFELAYVAKGYQFRTKQTFAPFVKNLYKLPKPRLSAPSMETLSIIVYQQPVTRLKIDEIRGVDCGGVLKTLLDRNLIRIVGRSEEAGRPILYGTSQTFLTTFGLGSLSDLPTLKDLELLAETAPTGGQAAEPAGQAAEREQDDSMEASDGESSELITELENSMRHLKDLEKNIFTEPASPSNEEPVVDKPDSANS